MKKVINYNTKHENTGVYRVCARPTTLKKSAEYVANYSEVSEKSIEKYLTKRAAEHGLLCLKYSNPNMVGYPDRLLVLPGGGVVWVELKSKGRKPTKIQQIRMSELTGMGHWIEVIDNKADIDKLIKTIKEWYTNHTTIR